MAKFNIGGQAVIEGVMMRGEREWSIAVRSPEGDVVTTKRPLNPLTDRYPILKKPVFRGIVSLIDSLVLGIKALSYSANISLGEDAQEINWKEWAGTMGLAAVFVVGLFMVTPYYLTRFLSPFKGNILFALFEGFFRIGMFLGYIAIISRMKDIQRVFQYHGAEHKVIHSFEAGEELTPDNAAKHSTAHMRCGTSFLLIVMVVSVFIFSFLPTASVVQRVLGKLLLIPVVAGLAYELVRLASRHPDSKALRLLVWPGLMLQRLTTREPDKEQLDVAIAALKQVLPEREPEPAVS
ncbi:MAG: DUF1385 domain-containing protein [Candidatus Aquicultorales bacterium]